MSREQELLQLLQLLHLFLYNEERGESSSHYHRKRVPEMSSMQLEVDKKRGMRE
jgi:hypothetical protein